VSLEIHEYGRTYGLPAASIMTERFHDVEFKASTPAIALAELYDLQDNLPRLMSEIQVSIFPPLIFLLRCSE